MGKWYGKIGYAETIETEPGIWEEQITERSYYGDVLTSRWMRQSSDKVNSDINISNRISIIADPFAIQNCSSMIYVEYAGSKWKISDIEIDHPRLIINLGGAYNGEQA